LNASEFAKSGTPNWDEKNESKPQKMLEKYLSSIVKDSEAI